VRLLLLVGKFPQLSETFIFRKAAALAREGHEVVVATRHSGDWESFRASLPLPANLSVVYLPPDGGPRGASQALHLARELLATLVLAPRRALQLLQRCREDPATRVTPWRSFLRHFPFLRVRASVLHFEFASLSAMYPLLPEVLRVPFVVSCRGSEMHLLEQKPAAEQATHLRVLRSATAIHCVSDRMAEEVRRVTERSEGIWVNRPAVEVEAITPRSGATAVEPPLVIAVGRLVWIKGFDYLLAAFRRLQQEGVPFRAQIVGDGPLFSELRYSIADLGLTGRVELVGALPPDQVIERLRQADLFVLSSHNEGISNAALEAMAAGLPVVTTRAGGMVEVVREGVDGHLVPVRDIGALAGRLRDLLLDPAARRRMGESARRRAGEEF
jgi:colanic acid/amylovoran biosynthesis glycosyltransferase